MAATDGRMSVDSGTHRSARVMRWSGAGRLEADLHASTAAAGGGMRLHGDAIGAHGAEAQGRGGGSTPSDAPADARAGQDPGESSRGAEAHNRGDGNAPSDSCHAPADARGPSRGAVQRATTTARAPAGKGVTASARPPAARGALRGAAYSVARRRASRYLFEFRNICSNDPVHADLAAARERPAQSDGATERIAATRAVARRAKARRNPSASRTTALAIAEISRSVAALPFTLAPPHASTMRRRGADRQARPLRLHCRA